MLISDLYNKNVITLHDVDTIEHAVSIFISKKVNGLIVVDILVKTMVILKDKKFSDDTIIAIIIDSYSPRGFIIEHGEISEIAEIWIKILKKISSTTVLSHLTEKISQQVEMRFKEARK